jgi:hypothetical protein
MATYSHRFVEALYDAKTGSTFVRHPEIENGWVDCELIHDIIKGCPTASVSGEDECEISSHLHGKSGPRADIPKKTRLHLTQVGHFKGRG